jgi:hypothetical protein
MEVKFKEINEATGPATPETQTLRRLGANGPAAV